MSNFDSLQVFWFSKPVLHANTSFCRKLGSLRTEVPCPLELHGTTNSNPATSNKLHSTHHAWGSFLSQASNLPVNPGSFHALVLYNSCGQAFCLFPATRTSNLFIYLFIEQKVDMFTQSHMSLGLRDTCLKVKAVSQPRKGLYKVLLSQSAVLVWVTAVYSHLLGKRQLHVWAKWMGVWRGRKLQCSLLCNNCIVTSWLPGVYLTEKWDPLFQELKHGFFNPTFWKLKFE